MHELLEAAVAYGMIVESDASDSSTRIATSVKHARDERQQRCM